MTRIWQEGPEKDAEYEYFQADFPPGTRVKLITDFGCFYQKETLGTIVKGEDEGAWTDDEFMHIARDDKMGGSGTEIEGTDRRAWVVHWEESTDYVCPIEESIPDQKSVHIMGLSPETIDWDAHKAFTKDMK